MDLSFARHRLTLPLARAARRFLLSKDWFVFGYARLEDHARERFGRSGRWVRDLGALAEAAERLPELTKAVDGDDGLRPIGSVLALLIGRTASPETCSQWIALARELTVREFREEIRKAKDAGSPSPLTSPDGDTDQHAITISSSERVSTSEKCRTESVGSAESSESVGSVGSPDSEARRTIRFVVPLPVRAAFEEARDLYSAVSGGDTSVVSFVEALVADACAGPTPPLELDQDRRRPDLAARERALNLASRGWAFLRERSGEGPALVEAELTLREVDRVCHEAEASVGNADALISALIRLDDEIERRLGQLLAEMSESRAWSGLEFTGIGHYGEERLGMSRTACEDRARLARFVQERPLVRDAYEDGRIGSEMAALILRALHGAPVDVLIDAAWVEHAAQTSVKRLRDEVRLLGRVERRNPLAAPPPPDDATWHASLSRRLGQAISRVARYVSAAAQTPHDMVTLGFRLPLDLAADLHAAVRARRGNLEGLARELRSPCRCTCGSCQFGDRAQANELCQTPFFVSAFDAAQESVNGCRSLQEDASGCRHEPGRASAPRQDQGGASGSDDKQEATGGFNADALPCDGCPSIAVHVTRTFSTRGYPLPEWVGLLGLIEDFVRTWDDPRQALKRPGDQVYIRDGWRCSAPGCTSRQNLEDHHIVYRSHGGSDDLSNRTTLCRHHHHRGEHGDLLECRGEAPLGLNWRLGRGGRGGLYRNEISGRP